MSNAENMRVFSSGSIPERQKNKVRKKQLIYSNWHEEGKFIFVVWWKGKQYFF